MPSSPPPADHPTRILTAGQTNHAPPLADAATGNLPAPEQPARQADRVARAGWLVLVALGLLVPWWFNLRYFADGGSVLPQVFFRDAMANALTTAITLDVYLAAVAFSAWVLGERCVRRPWLIVVACFGVGLSFALPLYLLLRRRRAA